MERKVLIVDDDADVRMGLALRLRAVGYRVCIAGGGSQAVAVAQAERPDLIVLDLGLPDGDGYEVMSRLRQYGALEDTPIVVLSGREAAFNRQRVIQDGAHAFLQKPVENHRLIETIERALRTRRAAGDDTVVP
jgi:CheY-like chemotaxis protein